MAHPCHAILSFNSNLQNPLQVKRTKALELTVSLTMKQKINTSFPKTPTGISGLDEVTTGGFPKGRSTLICGSAGCGKTLFGIQFLFKLSLIHISEPTRLLSISY